VAEIKNMISDILTIDESQRITAAGILEKYASWFNQ